LSAYIQQEGLYGDKGIIPLHIQKIEENIFNQFSTIRFFEKLGFGKYESFHLNSLFGLSLHNGSDPPNFSRCPLWIMKGLDVHYETQCIPNFFELFFLYTLWLIQIHFDRYF
jgi:hypothetical protein